MKRILWVVLVLVPLACYGDSIRVNGKRLDGVYVARNGHDYVIKSPEGCTQTVNERRVDTASIDYGADDYRAAILARWKANQAAQPTRREPDKAAVKTISVRREMDPATAQAHERDKAEIEGRNASVRQSRAQARAEAEAAEHARIVAKAEAERREQAAAEAAEAQAAAAAYREWERTRPRYFPNGYPSPEHQTASALQDIARSLRGE